MGMFFAKPYKTTQEQEYERQDQSRSSQTINFDPVMLNMHRLSKQTSKRDSSIGTPLNVDKTRNKVRFEGISMIGEK